MSLQTDKTMPENRNQTDIKSMNKDAESTYQIDDRGNNSHRKDPLYRAVVRHIKNKEWETSFYIAENLLKKYPDEPELQLMRTKLMQKVELPTISYRDNPLYRSILRHTKKGEWGQSLLLVNRLLKSYPHTEALHDMQAGLEQQIRDQKVTRQRNRLLGLFTTFALLFAVVGGLFIRYIINPAPISDIVAPQAKINYPPHYLFSIYNVDKPIGISLSPSADQIYVTEMSGARQVKIFDRKGNLIGSFEPPHTSIGERAPVYLTTDKSGTVYVSDRKQHVIYIFDSDGTYVDELLAPDLTLSEYIQQSTQFQLQGDSFAYNLLRNRVYYKSLGGADKEAVLPYIPEWSPLGIRIEEDGEMILTDVAKDRNAIHILSSTPQESLISNRTYNPIISSFGASGSGEAQFLFPNASASDSFGRIYISDGNNGRISVWDEQGNFLYNFGKGGGEEALSLPRGIFIDNRDRLHVVDAVGHNLKIYDVSGSEPIYLFSIGDFGQDDGLFNYPNDIAIDQGGRLYIADRENDRVQVWSY